MPPIDDGELERLLRDAAPRAPVGFAARAMARVEARARTRRRGVLYGAVAGLVAAAALLLMMRARPARKPAGAGAWTVTSAEGAVNRPAGSVLADGGELTVAAGGRAELSRAALRVVVQPLAGAEARVRVERGALTLERGAAEFDGDGTSLITSPARVIAVGDDAQVVIELSRRPTMSAPLKTAGAVAAVSAAVLSVYVLRGGARVEASAPGGGVALLGRGERALVADGTPPLALRTAAPAPLPTGRVSGERARPPIADANAKRPNATDERANANRPHAPTDRAADDDPEPRATLDKEEIRAGMAAILPKLQACYEAALEKNPRLAGRVVVEMKLRARDGKGKVDEAEVLYDESSKDDLNSPATEHCLLEQIAAADFAPPRGEGVVIVRYPFVLKAAEEE